MRKPAQVAEARNPIAVSRPPSSSCSWVLFQELAQVMPKLSKAPGQGESEERWSSDPEFLCLPDPMLRYNCVTVYRSRILRECDGPGPGAGI